MPAAVLEKYNILTDELKSEVNDFIDFLLNKNEKKIKAKKTLDEINDLFKDDKGWSSEEEMIEDMRKFRQSRMK